MNINSVNFLSSMPYKYPTTEDNYNDYSYEVRETKANIKPEDISQIFL